MSFELLTCLATPTSSYVTGGGMGGREREVGSDDLPLTLCMRYTPTTPSRTPIVRNTTLHTILPTTAGSLTPELLPISSQIHSKVNVKCLGQR